MFHINSLGATFFDVSRLHLFLLWVSVYMTTMSVKMQLYCFYFFYISHSGIFWKQLGFVSVYTMEKPQWVVLQEHKLMAINDVCLKCRNSHILLGLASFAGHTTTYNSNPTLPFVNMNVHEIAHNKWFIVYCSTVMNFHDKNKPQSLLVDQAENRIIFMVTIVWIVWTILKRQRKLSRGLFSYSENVIGHWLIDWQNSPFKLSISYLIVDTKFDFSTLC